MNVHSYARNKEVSLSRIRQLASSGLALEPFVRTIFELIGDSVPSSPHRAIHAGGELSDSYICSTQEVENIVPLHNHYFVESSAEISGARFRPDLDTLLRVMPTRTIWTQPESFLPNLYRAEGYNEAYRPLGWSHYTAVVFSDGHEYVGYYGMWRSADQKPFSREDIEFLRASARHVTHGLKVAQGAQAASTEPDGFAPLPAWGTGVVLIDSTGKPIAMDSAATLIFQQLGVLDGISANSFAAGQVRVALGYVASTLRTIFREPDGKSVLQPPVYRLYQHWSGIVLNLRGVRMIAADGREYISVLVERGETLPARRARLIARWGLSQREAEVLSLIGANKTGPEIAILLGISHDTVRKHISRVFAKLNLETRSAAAEIGRSLS